MQTHRQIKVNFARSWCITNPTPARRVTPPWNAFLMYDKTWPRLRGLPGLVWQTGLPALAGQLTYHVNVIKLKWEIIWTGGLTHLPVVPHLHVHKPLVDGWADCAPYLIWFFMWKLPIISYTGGFRAGNGRKGTKIIAQFSWRWLKR